MLSLLLSIAFAKQIDYDVKKTDTEWTFHYVWKDADKKSHEVSFSLPKSAISADNAIPTRFPADELVDAQIAAMRKYGQELPAGVKLKVSKSNGEARIQVSSKNGRRAMKDALHGAEEAAEAARDSWAKKEGYLIVDDHTMMVDYTKIITAYVDDIQPLAAALGAGAVKSNDPASIRKYLMTALSFVQNIPYEKRKNGGDAGFRRPLSLIARNKGDCDGKSALFLALVRAALPDIDAGIVLVPDHAFVAVAIAPEKGDLKFKRDGVEYVVMEPVGPAVVPIGEASRYSSRRVRLGAIDFKTVPD